MKKIAVALVALAMSALLFAGCSLSTDNSSKADTTANTTGITTTVVTTTA